MLPACYDVFSHGNEIQVIFKTFNHTLLGDEKSLILKYLMHYKAAAAKTNKKNIIECEY